MINKLLAENREQRKRRAEAEQSRGEQRAESREQRAGSTEREVSVCPDDC